MHTIDPFDYAGHICKALTKGVLLTTAAEGKVNTITIGWGTMGVEWGRPIFIAYVRESRYTKQLLDKNGEFTVNIPLEGCDKQILAFCGTKSGADVDKFQELSLTAVPSEVVSVPGIRELPLTLECKVLFKREQPIADIPVDIQNRYYATGDAHTAYYGQIVNAYIAE